MVNIPPYQFLPFADIISLKFGDTKEKSYAEKLTVGNCRFFPKSKLWLYEKGSELKGEKKIQKMKLNV